MIKKSNFLQICFSDNYAWNLIISFKKDYHHSISVLLYEDNIIHQNVLFSTNATYLANQ